MSLITFLDLSPRKFRKEKTTLIVPQKQVQPNLECREFYREEYMVYLMSKWQEKGKEGIYKLKILRDRSTECDMWALFGSWLKLTNSKEREESRGMWTLNTDSDIS